MFFARAISNFHDSLPQYAQSQDQTMSQCQSVFCFVWTLWCVLLWFSDSLLYFSKTIFSF